MKKNTLSLLAVTLLLSLPAYADKTCEKWGLVTVEEGEYKAQNNIWGAATAQCIEVDGPSFKVTRSDHNVPTNGSPASYPALYKGCHWGNCTYESGMPIKVSRVRSAVIDWSTSLPEKGIYNVTSEAWFKKDSIPGEPDGAELMLWLNHKGNIRPGGSLAGTAKLGGYTWEVWFSPGDWNFVTYRITSPTTSIKLDYKPFIDDAVSRGYLKKNWYLLDIEAGFEIWQGGAGLATNSLAITLNQDYATPGPETVSLAAPSPAPLQAVQQGAAVFRQRGDVNSSGEIDILDALLIAQYLAGLAPAGFDYSSADTNGNGKVEFTDALRLSRCYTRLIET